jgi:hypothetical protein
MDTTEFFGFDYSRRFGVEIELNSMDGRNRPLGKNNPVGADHIANLISRSLKKTAKITKWHHTHNNEFWVVKPDSSCGIEVCSPVSKGWKGLKEICHVVEEFSNDNLIVSDERCSLHVHIEVADLSEDEIASILYYWIKCEPVFLDSVPYNRKINRYSQFIGLTDLIEHDAEITPSFLISRLGNVKYYSLNTYHLKKGKRKTIEFRIIGNDGCLDAFLIKNWVRLIVHFVNTTSQMGIPRHYVKGDPWSSFLWLDTKDVFRLLGFWDNDKILTEGVKQTRDWFLARLKKNGPLDGIARWNMDGFWSSKSRFISNSQVSEMFSILGLNKIDEVLFPVDESLIYSKEFI